MNNPYPKFLIDEASGIEVPDIRHQLWEEGYRAGKEDERKMLVHRLLKALDGVVMPQAEESIRLPIDEGLGKELKKRRLLMGLTLKEFGVKSGVTASCIARIEKGQRVPSIHTLAKIEKALGGEK